MDRAGVDADGPLGSPTARRAFFALRTAVAVALLVLGLITGDASRLWWVFAVIFIGLGVIALRWRRARLL